MVGCLTDSILRQYRNFVEFLTFSSGWIGPDFTLAVLTLCSISRCSDNECYTFHRDSPLKKLTAHVNLRKLIKR